MTYQGPLLRALSREECLVTLGRASIGRVGFTSGALPLILPVTFRLDGESVVFGAEEGSPLARATADAIVAFQADSFDLARERGWTVLGVGPSVVTSDPVGVSGAGATPPPWTVGHAPDVVVRIELIQLSGHVLTG